MKQAIRILDWNLFKFHPETNKQLSHRQKDFFYEFQTKLFRQTGRFSVFSGSDTQIFSSFDSDWSTSYQVFWFRKPGRQIFRIWEQSRLIFFWKMWKMCKYVARQAFVSSNLWEVFWGNISGDSRVLLSNCIAGCHEKKSNGPTNCKKSCKGL